MSDFIALTVSERMRMRRIDDLIKPPMVDVLRRSDEDETAKRQLGKVVSDDNIPDWKLFLDAPAFANRDEVAAKIIRGIACECLRYGLE